MEKINDLFIRMYVVAACSVQRFREEERGDTNFISMLLIIGIAVTLAGLFLMIGRDTVRTIGENITNFLSSLGA